MGFILMWKRLLLAANQHYYLMYTPTTKRHNQALNPTTKDDKISTLFTCHHRSDIFPTNVNHQQEQKKTHKVQARLSPAFPLGVILYS